MRRLFGGFAEPVKWAIAGRNANKLAAVNRDAGANVEIIIADPDDVAALEALTARTKVVLSTAGPFHRYGSNLVAACVKNGSHYVDITGENFWVKGLIEKHHAEAAAKGVRIIPSCGTIQFFRSRQLLRHSKNRGAH